MAVLKLLQNEWSNMLSVIEELAPRWQVPANCPDIKIIGAQSAISMDCDVGIARSVFSNTGTHTGYRHNVVSVRSKLIMLDL